MYQEHELFEKPEQNAKIWRYMDFTKFISLLIDKSLFFVRADKLNDPFEGAWSEQNIKVREEAVSNFPGPPMEMVKKMRSLTYRKFRKFALINCWHLNQYESAAMWKLYLKSNEGIAIQSTFDRLTRSFNDDPKIFIHAGKVKYIDYVKDWMPENNLFFPFLHKRKSFEHENELRAIFIELPGKNGTIDVDAEPYEVGAQIPIDLDILIESIYVCPTAPEWFSSLIRKVIEKFEMDFTIFKSNLYDQPIY